MRREHQVFVLALFACTLLIVPMVARATNFDGTDMQLSICTVGGTCAATMDDGGTGTISFTGVSVGKWNINSGNAYGSDGPSGFPLPSLLDLSSFDANNQSNATGNDALKLDLTITGLTAQQLLQVIQAIGGTNNYASGNTTITSQAFISTTNAAFCTSGCSALTSLLSFTTMGLGQGFNGSTTGSNGPLNNPYSLDLVITLSAEGTGHTSFDGSLDMIPEPATLSVLGTGLLAFGTGMRRKLARG